jgi:hypothetical protein
MRWPDLHGGVVLGDGLAMLVTALDVIHMW